MTMLVMLPDENEMLRRLNTVELDDAIKKALYPLILVNANRELSAEGVVVFLLQAMMQYAIDNSWTEEAVLKAQLLLLLQYLLITKVLGIGRLSSGKAALIYK